MARAHETPAAGTAALRDTSALPNLTAITGEFGGADQLRNALNAA